MSIPANARPVAFVNVTDRDRGLAFYRDTLGLRHRGGDDFGDFLESGGGLVRMTPMPDHRPSQHPVLGWDVTDIRAAAEGLKRKGVSFTIYDGMGQDELGIWRSPDGSASVAWFADPDGNVLSLSQT